MKCDFDSGCRAVAVKFSVTRHYDYKILCRCGFHHGWARQHTDLQEFSTYEDAVAYQAMRCL